MPLYFPFSTIFEILCFCIGLVLLWKDKNLFWRLALVFLFITCVTEIYGSYLAHRYNNNLKLYNYFYLVEQSFISYAMYYFFRPYIKPKLLIGCGSIILILSNLYFFLGYAGKEFNNVSQNVSGILFIIYSLLYFYLFLKDKKYVQISTHPEFWWVTGILFFYFGSVIYNLFYGATTVKLFNRYINYYLITILNLILYSLWTYSFICRARQLKLQS
ncbi:putative membrane protein YfcA [Pedobacter sp. UYP30]